MAEKGEVIMRMMNGEDPKIGFGCFSLSMSGGDDSLVPHSSR